jgi:hypothetical protein
MAEIDSLTLVREKPPRLIGVPPLTLRRKLINCKFILTFVNKLAYYGISDKAKPAARRGRKATGLKEIAGLPGEGALWLFLSA